MNVEFTVVGGYDFPKIVAYLPAIVKATGSIHTPIKTYIFNDYDHEEVRLGFLEEKIERTLHKIGAKTGVKKIHRKGYWLLFEIDFIALTQIGTSLDVFLADLYKAEKIEIFPHKDMPDKYNVFLDSDWDFKYWLNRPFLGFKGTIRLRGVERLDYPPLAKRMFGRVL